MKVNRLMLAGVSILLLAVNDGCAKEKSVQRPAKVVSMREKVFDATTYQQLDSLWGRYYDAYPSEDAYGNWMYAARYAGDPNYRELLAKGLKKYPGNPTLLYLAGLNASVMQEPGAGIKDLEKAVALAPEYLDPWFSLTISYLCTGEIAKSDTALKHLLTGGAISESVMDYSYNMLTLLDQNAILITNGDNDTYPGWILTRIVGYRPDVSIVNCSLLESPWYPELLGKLGVQKFLKDGELAGIREKRFAEIAASKPTGPIYGVVADTLINRIKEVAEKTGRPVYLAATCGEAPHFTRLRANGINLGLVTQVTGIKAEPSVLAKLALHRWLNDFRTGGLDSWQIRYADVGDASKMVAKNYAYALVQLLEQIPDWRKEFQDRPGMWFDQHAQAALSNEETQQIKRHAGLSK